MSGLTGTPGAGRVRLNVALWLAVVLAGVGVIVIGVVMWNSHADDGGSVLTRIGHTIVDEQPDAAPDAGTDVGSGVVQPVAAAPAADQDRIAQVLVAATKFVNTFMNVDYRTMDSTFAAVRSMQTPTARKQFDKSVAATRRLVTNLKAVETAKVVWAGYSSGDADSAKVFVATQGTKTNTTDGKRHEVADFARVQIDLQHVGSTWLVNNITFLANQ